MSQTHLLGEVHKYFDDKPGLYTEVVARAVDDLRARQCAALVDGALGAIERPWAAGADISPDASPGAAPASSRPGAWPRLRRR
ncbi:hypothetical protein GCM10027418_04240 [Mariniluteicoccus endophyticus]